MKMKMISSMLVTIISISMLFSCGASKKANISDEDKTITIMAPLMVESPPKEDSEILKTLEEKTGYEVNINWVPNVSYGDKLSVIMASDDCPEMIMANKEAVIVNAVKNGAMWKLDDYLEDYENLNKANKDTMLNASFNYETYGIYRTRDVARFATIIRKDWLDKLGLKEPKTLDEFTAILKAFRDDDPDGNGKDDTYGMIIPKWGGTNSYSPLDQMAVWFGSPNAMKIENGEIIPDFMTDEYMASLDYFKMLYDEKLMNSDFALKETSKWDDDFISGKAGVIVDTQTRAFNIAKTIAKNNGRTDENGDQWVTMIDNVVTPTGGDKVLPTPGYSGMYMIPKQSVKDEKQLRKVLDFLNKINSEELTILLQRGIEGKQYEIKENGYVNIITGNESVDKANSNDLNSFWQISPNVANYDIHKEDKGTNLEKIGKKLLEDGNKKMVVNETAPLMSDVYATKGVQLVNIIADARIKYIAGQIDKEGYKAAINQWLNTGGQEYLEELETLYAKYLKK